MSRRISSLYEKKSTSSSGVVGLAFSAEFIDLAWIGDFGMVGEVAKNRRSSIDVLGGEL